MSSPKHSLKSSPSRNPQETQTPGEELLVINAQILEKNTHLTERNAQLVQEVQKLKQTNGTLVRRVIDLTRKALEASSENNRYKESLKRISSYLERFVPCMVTGTQFLDAIAGEIDRASVPRNLSTSPVSNEEGVDDLHSGTSTPASPLRTGIARPIVQGHTISKPSISLQRVESRPYVPLPIRGLNLADLVRADDQDRPLASVREEDANGNEEDEESDENETERNDSPGSLLNSIRESEGNPIVEASDNRVSELSVVPEESSIVDETLMEITPVLEQTVAVNLPPIVKEHDPSRARLSNTLVRKSRRRSEPKSEEEHLESSDDEAVELSLIEARCKLMNVDRRKELKEGTSKDYDARGNLSPSLRRKRKRKRKRKKEEVEEVSLTKDEPPNEMSALRRSVGGLLNSIKKTRYNRSRRSPDEASSPVTARVNGFVNEGLDPRVSLVRMSSFRMSSLSQFEEAGSNGTVYGERPSLPPPPVASPPRLPSLSIVMSPSDGPSPPPVPSTPVFPSPAMVTKRKRRSYVTARSKRSCRQPAAEVVDVVLEMPEVPDEQPRRSYAKKGRKSWAELMKKRSRTQLDSDSSEDDTGEKSPRPSTETNNIAVFQADELPTIVLSRCSDRSIPRQSSKGLQYDNDSSENSDTPLSRLVAHGSSENIAFAGNTSNCECVPKRGKQKARSKPKAQPKAPSKTANGGKSMKKSNSNESLNSVVNEFENSLNPSLLNSSKASVGDAENTLRSPGRISAAGRPRRATAPTSLRERPLNVKMRRN